MRIQRTSFARNLPACQLANDNLLYGHLASHPYYGCAFVFVETLAHHKNLNFRTAGTACAVRCILARFEPERLDIAFGGATAEVDDDMLWQINNYFDGVAADNMTVIFAQSARLQESIEELRSIANSLYAAIKGENPVGAPPLVWPSFRNLGFIATTLLNRSRLPKTADNILDLMIRAVLRGVHNPADDNDLEEIGALGTSLDLILEDQAAARPPRNVVILETL